jgi:integrative and conjugative element protein (TIGR02256 family)
MMHALHSWWEGFGTEISANNLTIPRARTLAQVAERGLLIGGRLSAIKVSKDKLHEAILLELDVERPQDSAVDIKRREPIAIVFQQKDSLPEVRAVRTGFPRTIHQNYSKPSEPPWLCIDDRPWQEAKLSYTASNFAQRIQLWLSRAARNELHATDQPLEPIFYGNGLKLVISRGMLLNCETTQEIIAFADGEHSQVLQAVPLEQLSIKKMPLNRLIAVGLKLKRLEQARMRTLPYNADELAVLLAEYGVDLRKIVSDHVTAWAGLSADNLRRLESKFLLIVGFPLDDTNQLLDVRGFLLAETAGNLGVVLGVLERNSSGIGNANAFVRRIQRGEPSSIDAITVAPVEVHFEMDRELGAAVSGTGKPDLSNAILIGAGSLGSQLAISLAREGSYRWTIVDEDVLLPHNFARHALFPSATGIPKAEALAATLSELLCETPKALVCDFLKPNDECSEILEVRLNSSQIIIDASASVAVSRHLADLNEVGGRRVSIFFNPSGTSLVILCEDRARNSCLRDLEAAYHRLVQTHNELSDHLRTIDVSMRYSGSCRSATNRIPASNAALLSALAAKQLRVAISLDAATIGVWKLEESGEISSIFETPQKFKPIAIGDWEIRVDEALLASLAALRSSRLPNETGGILLGVVDTDRKLMHLVHALDAPPDSKEEPTAFERGTQGLLSVFRTAQSRSMHQLTYVGEWHSHPNNSAVMPSAIDIDQFRWLSEEMRLEETPVVMLITGEQNAFSILVADRREGIVGNR